MTMKRSVVTGLFAVSLVLASGLTWAAGQYGPGASDTEIKLGNTMPYSGPTSAYGVIGKAEAAYFNMINEQGGIGLTYACGARRLLCLVNWRKGLKPVQPRVSIESTETATAKPYSTAHEAMLALTEIFSNLPNRNNTNRRTYVLELEDGEPVFRRDEFCLAFDSALNEVFGPKAGNDGDDIVPQKLSKLFPGRRRSQDV
jgi:hypothetical protein